MTALERALVVYAEAKGYEVERQSRGQIEKWELLEQPIGFNFAFNRYRLRDPRNMHKVCNSLYAEYLPNIPEKSISEMVENIKKFKPAGFSCKTKILTREEIEEMNKPKEEEFDVKAYVKSLVRTPEYLERCKEVDPIIEILEAYKNGETIERKEKYSSYEWSECETMELFNPMDFDYRIVPKVQDRDPLKITDKEILYLKRNFVTAKRIGDGCVTILNKNYITEPNEWLYFNAKSQKWQRGLPNE